MNETLVAKNALAAYLIISLVRPSVTTNGASRGAYRSRMMASAWGLLVPMTMRLGCMKSATAEPSRRNSGLLTTSTRCRRAAFSAIIAETISLVSTGTVDFTTTIFGPFSSRPIVAATSQMADRSTPSS